MAILHAKDKIFFSLEAQVELRDEGMPTTLLEDLSFIFDNVLFFIFNNEMLVYNLHCHESSVASGKIHF